MRNGGTTEGHHPSPARRLLRWGLTLGAIGVLAAAGFAFLVWRTFTAPGPAAVEGAEATIVVIDRGMGVSAIGRRLSEAGVITNVAVFRAGVMVLGRGSELQAGEFSIPSGASMEEIVTLLADGQPVSFLVTIPEGKTSRMAVAILNEDTILSGEIAEVPAEGTLLPETYHFQRGTTRAEMIARMTADRDALLAELWANRAPDLPFDTVEEAVILASIVEKETGLASERPRIAGLFVNRMRIGMRLQSDPTIIYGLTGGEPLGRGIRRSELDRETPYNTYLIDGLPPTPICNPGRDSLAAVLNPMQTDELYFVADGTGGHAFARTLEEHNRNVAHWREIERRNAQGGN